MPDEHLSVAHHEADQVLAPRISPLETMIRAWLHAKRGKSGSPHTAKAYARTLKSYRAYLLERGYDLDSPATETLSLLAQAWAARSWTKKNGEAVPPSPATFNQRLSCVSSFYRYALRHKVVYDNPIDLLADQRRKVQPYGKVQDIPFAPIQQKLAAIDTSSLAGKRDYALLTLTMATGRRVAEVAALTWGDVRLTAPKAVITFARCKGGKQMADTLGANTTAALLAWLRAFYGDPTDMAPEQPLWVSLSHLQNYGGPLSVRSLELISQQRLGIHFHGLRHINARLLEAKGAKVSEIRDRLGHSDLSTTGQYLASLGRADNPYADAIDAALGGEEG
jgi:integrase/recombinase XerC